MRPLSTKAGLDAVPRVYPDRLWLNATGMIVAVSRQIAIGIAPW
jgi:hypothetical protein